MVSNTPHRCIVCSSTSTKVFLDLGNMAYANQFVGAEQLVDQAPGHPLRVSFCEDCYHVQLADPAPPKHLFEHYLYVSSVSSTLRNHLYGLAETVISRLNIPRNSLIVDVGCNDGTLLEGFRKQGCDNIYGVDPAKNLAPLAANKGIRVEVDFFTSESAMRVGTERSAQVITMTNSFPHVPNLAELCAAFDYLLADDGVIVIEAQYLVDLLACRAFDTVYHEHVSYWALRPAMRLFGQYGFEVIDVERLPVHHGQLRYWIQREGVGVISPAVQQYVDLEQQLGLHSLATYEDFGKEVCMVKKRVLDWLERILGSGQRVAGYGAPAKGNTLLSYLGLGTTELEYIADKSPLKQGLYTPGTHIPVVAPKRLTEDRPDYLLVLALNFIEEIMAEQRDYYEAGGRFFVAMPELKEMHPSPDLAEV